MFYNTPIDISFETWCGLLADKSITTEEDFRVFQIVYDSPNHEASGSEIAEKLGITHHGILNLQMSRFSKRVVQKTGIQPPLRRDGNPRWWHIPFLGYETGGRFPWIMRQELVMAFEEIYEKNVSETNFLDEISLENLPPLAEGVVKQVSVNRYERNRKARNICIAYHGTKCKICEFDFEKVYGPIGKNKIHVHHIKPIAKIGHGYIIDPIHDLIPVCPNCHTIIHSKNEPFSIDEVKEILTDRGNGV